jgi:transposase InsO family protein
MAYPLRTVTAEDVSECLLDFSTDKGIPDQLVSDNGTNFTSELIQQMCSKLQIRQIFSSVYHPEANGLVERWNGTMKRCLKKFVCKHPKEWDHYLKYILFAYREVP